MHRHSNPDKIINDLEELSNIINNYFGSVYSQDDNITSQNFTVPIHAPMPTVILHSIKIKRVLSSIKSSSPGPDSIHPKILKNLADDLSIPLAVIFTNSHNSSSIMNAWKFSNVCPKYKGSGS